MATEKDRLTNAIVALIVGAVFLLSRDYFGLLIASTQTWVSEVFSGRRRMGGGVFELLLELVIVVVLFIIAVIIHIFLWIINVLNDFYILPVVVMLIVYATPWPFRLGFLNPVPYAIRGGQWVWNMVVLSTYGEYLRRGKGKSVVFILLPIAGCIALSVGAWGLWGSSLSLSGLEALPVVNRLPSIMPRERVVYLNKGAGNITAGNIAVHLKIQKVMLSRYNTRVVFRFWRPDPRTTKIRWSQRAGLSAQTYLADNQGNHYSVLGSEGMILGQSYYLEIDKPTFSTLIFEPLREGVTHFDLHFHNLEGDQWWSVKDVKIQ